MLKLFQWEVRQLLPSKFLVGMLRSGSSDIGSYGEMWRSDGEVGGSESPQFEHYAENRYKAWYFHYFAGVESVSVQLNQILLGKKVHQIF